MKIHFIAGIWLANLSCIGHVYAQQEINGDYYQQKIDITSSDPYYIGNKTDTGIYGISRDAETFKDPINLVIGDESDTSRIVHIYAPEYNSIYLNVENSILQFKNVTISGYNFTDDQTLSYVNEFVNFYCPNIGVKDGNNLTFSNKNLVSYDKTSKELSPRNTDIPGVVPEDIPFYLPSYALSSDVLSGNGNIKIEQCNLNVYTSTNSHTGSYYLENASLYINPNNSGISNNFNIIAKTENKLTIHAYTQSPDNNGAMTLNYQGTINVDNSSVELNNLSDFSFDRLTCTLGDFNLVTGSNSEHFSIKTLRTDDHIPEQGGPFSYSLNPGLGTLRLDIQLDNAKVGQIYEFAMFEISNQLVMPMSLNDLEAQDANLMMTNNLEGGLINISIENLSLDSFQLSEEAQKSWKLVGIRTEYTPTEDNEYTDYKGYVGKYQTYLTLQSIPEPSTATLGILGLAALCFRRRRH